MNLSLSVWPARIVQHEVDHLDGIIYVHRMDPTTFVSNGAADEIPTPGLI